jgi:glycosyltransferase involved in cell wall biosynthesis
LLASQLQWQHGIDLLTAEGPNGFAEAIARLHADPELWHRLRQSALRRVALEYSPAMFRETLRLALEPDTHP